jgi:1-acyl-sn-glycerol-3-phosphate acyltransferase
MRLAFQLLRSIVFTTLFFAVTGIYAIVLILVGWLPIEQRQALAKTWGQVLLWLLAKLCGLTHNVSGIENLPGGAHIAMWKHSSAWETIAQVVVCPPQAWVLKREIMWIPLVGWAINFLQPIAINRSAGTTAVNKIVAQGQERLASGAWVVIFPEGTRVPEGETRKYGLSGALLASRAGCNVIPVAHNAGNFWPRRGWLKKPGTIQVVIGPPIEAAGRDPRSINNDVQQWIETTLKTLG